MTTAVATAPLLDPAETFSARSERDALGRVLDGSEVAYGYDEGGGRQTVELKHRRGATAQTVVGEIEYDARGQRTRVVYGSRYTYDPHPLIRFRTIGQPLAGRGVTLTEIRISGDNVCSLATFLERVSNALDGPGAYFGWDIHSFQDCLLGGCAGRPPYHIIVTDADDLVSAFDHRGLARYYDGLIRVIQEGGRGLIRSESLDWFHEAAAAAHRGQGETLLEALLAAVRSTTSSLTLHLANGDVIGDKGTPANP